MGKRGDDKQQGDGQRDVDPRKLKPVEEAGGGKHSRDDRGEDKGDQGKGKK